MSTDLDLRARSKDGAEIVVEVGLAVIALPATATAAPDEADRGGLQRQVDDVVAAGAVGALAEVRDEHGVWRSTSGVAELGTTRPVPVSGRFRVGSITKTFVATVVLQLVGEGPGHVRADRRRAQDSLPATTDQTLRGMTT